MYDITRLARRKGNIPHKSDFSFERNHDPGILQEIERSAIPFSNEHEVYPCSSIFHNHGQLIKTAILNTIHWYCPGKNTKGELQGVWGETDQEGSVVQ